MHSLETIKYMNSPKGLAERRAQSKVKKVETCCQCHKKLQQPVRKSYDTQPMAFALLTDGGKK